MPKPTVPLALALAALTWSAGALPAVAATMQPGLWRFTQTTQGGNRAITRIKTQCVTPAQAADPARYFTPAGAGCVLAAHSSFGSRISSTLRCAQGATRTEVTAMISFASPARLSISTRMTTSANGRSATATMTGEGERLRDCGREKRRRR